MHEKNLLVRWTAAVLAAAALLAAAGAEPAGSLSTLAAFAFWVAHVGIGLTMAIWVTQWLSTRFHGSRTPPLLILLIAGLVGSVLFAPLALAMDGLFPAGVDDDDPLWLRRLEQQGVAGALVAEWIHLLPTYLLTWLVINVTPFFRPTGDERAAVTDTPKEPAHTRPTAGNTEVGERILLQDAQPAQMNTAPDPITIPSAETTPSPDPLSGESLLDRLPAAIGREIISVRSDLHYLHVRTTKGRATLLGTLAELDQDLGDTGLRVHRSFWITKHQVKRVIRAAQGWQCEMRDGSRVPVARRRQADVRMALGRDFVVVDE